MWVEHPPGADYYAGGAWVGESECPSATRRPLVGEAYCLPSLSGRSLLLTVRPPGAVSYKVAGARVGV